MHRLPRHAIVATAASALVLGSGLGAGAAPARPAGAGAAPPHVVTVHMGGNHIWLSGDAVHHTESGVFRLRTSEYVLRIVTKAKSSALQIARLRGAYTFDQAARDVNKAFRGDTDAVARVDRYIDWRGGVGATSDKPGRMSVSLPRGTFFFLDQGSEAVAQVRMFGSRADRAPVATDGTVTAFTYGWKTSKDPLPASGTARFTVSADQPHFVVMVRIKDGTSRSTVRKYFKSGDSSRPDWVIGPQIETGTVSPGHSMTFDYDVPAGTYLIACFWPDRDTGAPHALMGMWDIVHVA